MDTTTAMETFRWAIPLETVRTNLNRGRKSPLPRPLNVTHSRSLGNVSTYLFQSSNST